MRHSTASKPKGRLKGKALPIRFEDIVRDETALPVMREIAAAAASRGLTLSEVARRINERHGYKIAASNVRRYLTSKARPQQETVEMLVRVIGLSQRHVALASGTKLKLNEYREIEQALRLDLTTYGAAFAEGATVEAQVAFDRLGDNRLAVLDAYELQRQRGSAWMLPVSSADEAAFDEHHPLSAFSKELRRLSGFDLLSRLRRNAAHEGLLWDVWLKLIPPLGPFASHDAEAVIATAVGVLRLRGVETGPMETQFRREREALRRAEAVLEGEG